MNHRVFFLLMGFCLPPACAHEGHADAPPAPTASSPQRLPDGSVLLPKPAQRQLGIRTVLTVQKQLPRSVELAGTVVIDPNAGGKVQAAFAGRLEAGPHGLPTLGQTVRKGEVLAYIRSASGGIEQANQSALAAELRAARALAERRVARLQQLEGSVPQKDIDAARLELQSASERLAAVSHSLQGAEALTAPASGVVASVGAVAGQLVDARETLFEIVDPARMRVEALAYDGTLAADIAAATASPEPGVAYPLTYLGAGRVLREQAIPIQFKLGPAPAAGLALAVGQPVKVLVQSRAQVNGYAVPALAVVKNPANQDIVWVHAEAQRFVPKAVRVAPLDGAGVSVIEGLAGGERVVVQGASLLNQVR